MRDRFLWIGVLVYAVVLTVLGTIKYDVHRNLVDFGIFAQTAASAFGCFCNPIEGSHWAFHFSPVLYGVGAAIALLHAPLTLIALQSAACALVAPPIYAIVRARSGVGIARLSALTVWLYPPLAGLAFGDFHENGLAPAAVAWTLYAFDSGYIGWSIAGAALTLSIKEDQAIFLAVAGLAGAWRYRGTPQARVAAGITAASLLVCAFFFLLVQPHAAASASPQWQPERFYSWGAGDAHGLGSALLARLGFLVLVFAPLAFLPLRSGAIVLAIAPLAEVLLSRMPTTYTLGTHYAGAWIGYLLIAFAFAVVRCTPRIATRLLAVSLALCALEFAVADPLHPGLNLRGVQARDAELDSFLTSLPRGASIATQEEAYTHLALDDPFVRLLPEDPNREEGACFVLIDEAFPESARLQEYGSAMLALVKAKLYRLAARSDGISLFRRAGRCR